MKNTLEWLFKIFLHSNLSLTVRLKGPFRGVPSHRLYSEIDHIHLSSEAQCVSHHLPPMDCHIHQGGSYEGAIAYVKCNAYLILTHY